MDIVEIEGLTKVYKKSFRKSIKAIDNLNLEIEKGEIFGFLGPNGAGKTTTLKVLAGLLYLTSGRIWILGEEIQSIEPKEKIGFLPEHPSFYNHLTGYELLDYAGGLFAIPVGKRRKRIKDFLGRVGLKKVGNIRISEYSKGMVQRLGIAQALVNNPELVILDEPLSGLDPIGRKEVKDIILSLKEQGKTVFFSTHILSDVERICDRVGILHKGRLLKVGSLSELLADKKRKVNITFKLLKGRKTVPFKNATPTAEGYWNVSVEREKQEEIVRSLVKQETRIISIIPETMTLENFFVSEIEKDET
jgi:ABC-2 type transport system ATP-binding protein